MHGNGIAPVRARLTSEFLWDLGPYGFKACHVKLIWGLTFKLGVWTWLLPMQD